MSKENNLLIKLLDQINFPTSFADDQNIRAGEIKKVEIYSKERTWVFHLFFNELLDFPTYQALVEGIKLTFKDIATTKVLIETEKQADLSAKLAAYWPYFVQQNTELPTVLREVFGQRIPEITDNQLIIATENSIISKLFTKEIQTQICAELQKFGFPELGIKVIIDDQVFQTNLANLQKQKEEHEAQVSKTVQEKVASQANEKQSDKSVDTIGAKIANSAKITPMIEVQEEANGVIFEGNVFQIEIRKLRNGSHLAIGEFTDYTDSFSFKRFIKDAAELPFFENLKKGTWIRTKGNIQEDMYSRELSLMVNNLEVVSHPGRVEEHEGDQQRVELHLHTNMSQMDATNKIGDFVKLAASLGQKAIAVTDHACAQSFPDAHAAGKANNIKIIYGVEVNLVDDHSQLVINPQEQMVDDAEYVIFDVETTGLSAVYDTMIEIGAVKMKNGEVIGRFDEFINPHHALSNLTINLTSITDDMVRNADDEADVIGRFREFMSDCVLAGHNVTFDIGFINAALKRANFAEITRPVIDTLEVSRLLNPEQSNHKLDSLAKKYNIVLEHHHRADSDAETTGYLMYKLLKIFEERFNEKNLLNFNNYGQYGESYKRARPSHLTVIAKTQAGLKNLFKIVSKGNTEYFYRVPRITKSELVNLREGLIFGSACSSGAVFTAMMQKGYDEARELAKFYDYLEVQPPQNYQPLLDSGLIESEANLQTIIKQMVELGEELNIPVVATGDAHYLNPEDHLYRDILIKSLKSSPLRRQKLPELYFRTTQEMLDSFSFLPENTRQKIVIDNPNLIADSTDNVVPVKGKLYTPDMPGAEDDIQRLTKNKAHELYGEELPKIVADRLDLELHSIIKNGFSVIYLISQKLVYKSNKDGYLVGSRGSVGSSLVATMTGITEVNPLPPHYRCPNCKYSEFFTKGEYGSGFDLPDKKCPNCQTDLVKDGHDIPFATFLGFTGNKVPDIDLNFSGDYQPVAHNYTKVLFGEDHVFRAGTIATVADKTAFGYVKHYEEEMGLHLKNAELDRLATGTTGVKRTTGQHPAGIIVVPEDLDIYDFTPIQYPADDQNAAWKTTHFDFHSIHDNILKLDILGHDDPTMIRMLQDLSGVEPKSIPTDDPGVMKLFSGTESLGVTPDQIFSKTGTLGVPEFGTKFVRGMLEETNPDSFSELLQISGLSHGTDVWLGNAEELISQGVVTLKDVIGCRDNIMMDLIHWGVDDEVAFGIMESVRKGKGIKDEWQEIMKANENIPDWYIDSCLKIKYMFPKAHATAYILMALRIAWFKVYYPIMYYTAYFSVRADDFNLVAMSRGKASVKAAMKEITDKGNDASTKEKNSLTVLELANECLERGFNIKMVDVNLSDAKDFTIVDDKTILAPFNAIPGLGDNVAKQIIAAREEKPFLSQEDLANRGKISKTIMEYLKDNQVVNHLPEENQLSLF